MKIGIGSRIAVSICAAALLTSCGGPQSPVGHGAIPQASALTARPDSTNYNVVYSFGGGSDGADPVAPLIYVGSQLYGTTSEGGSYSCIYYRHKYPGCGTVFSVTLGGKEKVLHSFGAGIDGQNPSAGLVYADRTLYGTTIRGGSGTCNGYYSTHYFSCGTVFSITRNGKEKVLHSFVDSPDGSLPDAGLIDVNGTLYGTTETGGGHGCFTYTNTGGGCGTVFSITTAGKESVLYAFSGGYYYGDGEDPYAGLVDVKGTLYGTTGNGGTNGGGTAFSVTAGGAEKVLNNFGNGSNGSGPHAGLIEVKGKLYGTTTYGGAVSCAYHTYCGTVFSLTLTGTEKVLHTFGGGSDGAYPVASLVELNGKLYGTTTSGGVYDEGTVFSITRGGNEKVLHDFGNTADGSLPDAGLIDVNGTLYGTTESGGAHGYGTVFSLKP